MQTLSSLLEKLEKKVSTKKRPSQNIAPMSLVELGRHVFGAGWKDGKHIQYLNDKLTDVIEGRIKRLIIEMPPRYAKTTMACQLMVPKYLSKHPHHRAIYTTYQADKASEWGRKCRDVIEQFGEQLNIQVRSDSRASNSWNLKDTRGGMLTAGVGGPLIGSGANLLIVDDPIKNHEEADSPLQREKLWDWIQSTAFTRLEPDAAVVIIMHRWRKDDIVGRIRQEALVNGEHWEVLTLPALAGEKDQLGRQPGECLWPERFPLEEVQKRQKSTPPRWWFSLYQQNPQLEDGSEWPASWFDDTWVDDFPPISETQFKVLALDPSKGKTDKVGDYSAYVMLVYGKDQNIYLGADMSNRRNAEIIIEDGLRLLQKYKPDAFAIETNASQDLFGPLFRKSMPPGAIRFDTRENNAAGALWCEYEHWKSKVGRIREWGQYINPVVHRVRFVRSMPQTQLMLDHFMMFPMGGKDPGVDDGCDGAALALECALQLSYFPALHQHN